jgi:hypothetical protein
MYMRAAPATYGLAHGPQHQWPVTTFLYGIKDNNADRRKTVNEYLQYAFYAINIYLEKVIEDFHWGNTRARQSGNLAARAQI